MDPSAFLAMMVQDGCVDVKIVYTHMTKTLPSYHGFTVVDGPADFIMN